jgi:hypothetical protein
MTKKRTAYSDTFKAEAVAKLKENDNNVIPNPIIKALPTFEPSGI